MSAESLLYGINLAEVEIRLDLFYFSEEHDTSWFRTSFPDNIFLQLKKDSDVPDEYVSRYQYKIEEHTVNNFQKYLFGSPTVWHRFFILAEMDYDLYLDGDLFFLRNQLFLDKVQEMLENDSWDKPLYLPVEKPYKDLIIYFRWFERFKHFPYYTTSMILIKDGGKTLISKFLNKLSTIHDHLKNYSIAADQCYLNYFFILLQNKYNGILDCNYGYLNHKDSTLEEVGALHSRVEGPVKPFDLVHLMGDKIRWRRLEGMRKLRKELNPYLELI